MTKASERVAACCVLQVPRDAVTLPLARYDPMAHAPWEPGQPTPYLHLARALEAMDATTKRLHISGAALGLVAPAFRHSAAAPCARCSGALSRVVRMCGG